MAKLVLQPAGVILPDTTTLSCKCWSSPCLVHIGKTTSAQLQQHTAGSQLLTGRPSRATLEVD